MTSSRVTVAASIHLHGDGSTIEVTHRAGEYGDYSQIRLGPDASVFVETVAQADALIRVACAAKDHLAASRLNADRALQMLRGRLDGSVPDPDPVERVATTGGVL